MAGCIDLSDGFAEDLVSEKPSTPETAAFDDVIGHIQDILLDDKFADVQRQFMLKHCHHFDEAEENKFIYTEIFQQYTDLVEGHLERELQQRIPTFSMLAFLASLEKHKAEIGEEIFDLLLSFSDFLTFKETILSYKAAQEGASLEQGALLVTSLSPKR